MRRVSGSGYTEAIEHAYGLLPSGIADRLVGVDFLCGVDPRFAGLEGYDQLPSTWLGRSPATTASAHCDATRRGTVVLPVPVVPAIIIHELGHILDHRLGFDVLLAPLSWYAAMNRDEAFACAFGVWIGGPLQEHWANQGLWENFVRQPKALAYFEALADVSA